MEMRHSFHILAHQGMASPEESSCGGACAASLVWLPGSAQSSGDHS